MKIRLLYFLLLFFAFSAMAEFRPVPEVFAMHINKTDKDKKKKKKKKKKQASPTAKPQTEKEKAKAKKLEEKKQRQRDKSVAKVQKEREKKNKKKQEEMDAQKPVYTKCDSADVVRTSTDTLLLKKYIKVYQSLGGICYIIHLQKMGNIKKSGEGMYYVKMKQTDDKREIANWKTYLFCPVGKPDGTVALINPEGDTIQQCTYKAERKNGSMIFYKQGGKIAYQEEYVNDVRVSDMNKED
ncbi:MAG: hypothetical protein IM638_06690 [Bacteroidetes bacterium]|nr:hypothetical protein [Bacteroidota bacterium]